MSMQSVFDQILAHLRQQGVPSFDRSRSACLYRGPRGTKCALGCLIPDELYQRDFEGKNVAGLSLNVRRHLEVLMNVGRSKADEFLMDCQAAHDDNCTDQHWLYSMEEKMKAVADKYGLAYSQALPAVEDTPSK